MNNLTKRVITTVTDINTQPIEGKLLLAALAKITTESQTNKTPDEVIEQLNKLEREMFVDSELEDTQVPQEGFANEKEAEEWKQKKLK